ncbi:MAG TPA: triose-phosphate isomerase, partial [Dehalococcoidia bacterium]|nr:triose-phosphate isomerase [Dehalococcoidia bacterium]
TPANVAEIVSQPEVDGGLVGGASLVASSFADLVRAAAAVGPDSGRGP